MRNALPNVTFIGFTGTPIDFNDKYTIEMFGDYIDIYDMTQVVEDVNCSMQVDSENNKKYRSTNQNG